MFGLLVSHNEDISKLVSKGYAVGFESGYLIIRDIPYLNQNGDLSIGAIVSVIVSEDQLRIRQQDHQIYFCGSHPHNIDGTPIRNLGGGAVNVPLLSKDIVIERSFSNKPPSGFADFFEKIENYVTIVSGPAMSKFNASPYTFRTVEGFPDSPFKIHDTLTSRAEISDLNQPFHDDIVAVIGLGGTGAYIIDFLTKTPVKEIRGFDGDRYHVHNAFRSPGRLCLEELGNFKAEVYQGRYDSIKNKLLFFNKYITIDSSSELLGVTFAFVCIDDGSARKDIFELLTKMKIPFIDVGMGLDRRKGPISACIRTTFCDSDCDIHLINQLAPMTNEKDDIYNKNMQIAELNALNACIAIIKYKSLRNFYQDDNKYFHELLSINDLHVAGK